MYDPLEWRVVAIVSGYGESGKMVVLPDSSQVWLNENTTLTYRKPFWRRQVELDGEAFFEVTHDGIRSFSIFSGEAKVTVLGTTFNVRAYPGENQVEVTVKTGKVRLEDRETRLEDIVLEAKETGVFEKETGRIQEKEEEMVNADAWRTKVIAFGGTPIRDVFATLERYYGIKITLESEALLNCSPMYGTMSYSDPPLEELVEVLEKYFNADFEKVDEKAYRVSGEGCPAKK